MVYWTALQVQFEAYYACSGLLDVFSLILIGIMFVILTKFSLGISLLKAVSGLT